jgi:hypothetical protein
MLGSWMKPFATEDEAERVGSSLGGTCLTRAMTIASLLPGAEIVIATTRPSRFAAHAWVERRGRVIFREPDVGVDTGHVEVVRLR